MCGGIGQYRRRGPLLSWDRMSSSGTDGRPAQRATGERAQQRWAADAEFLARYGELPRSLRVQAGEVELHLLEWGDPDAPPMLMVHGMRGHARWFSPVGPAMGERYRALSLDLRGHGHSDPGDGGGQTTYADDLLALVEAMELEGLTLVGHSMGGSVVVRAAGRLEARLKVLVTVDAGLGPPPRSTRQNPRPRPMSEPRPRRYFDSYETGRERFVLRPGGTVAEPELLDHLALHALRELPDGRFTWRFEDPSHAQPARPQPRSPLDGSPIRCPVLGIYGSGSPILQRRDPRTFGERFPSAACTRVEILQGAHHHVMLDRPAEYSELLLSMLAGL